MPTNTYCVYSLYFKRAQTASAMQCSPASHRWVAFNYVFRNVPKIVAAGRYAYICMHVCMYVCIFIYIILWMSKNEVNCTPWRSLSMENLVNRLLGKKGKKKKNRKQMLTDKNLLILTGRHSLFTYWVHSLYFKRAQTPSAMCCSPASWGWVTFNYKSPEMCLK